MQGQSPAGGTIVVHAQAVGSSPTHLGPGCNNKKKRDRPVGPLEVRCISRNKWVLITIFGILVLAGAIISAALIVRTALDNNDAGDNVGQTQVEVTFAPTMAPLNFASSPSLSVKLFCADGITNPPSWLIRFASNKDCSDGLKILKEALGAGFDMTCCSCGPTPRECTYGETVLTALSVASCHDNAELFFESTGTRFSCLERCANTHYFWGAVSRAECEAALDLLDFSIFSGQLGRGESNLNRGCTGAEEC